MYRTILNEIQNLIEKGNGATEEELKQLWNGLSNAITESEQLNLPPVIKSVYCDCKDRSSFYRDKEDNDICYDCDLMVKQ